jgi:hypothetical protein
MPLLDIYAENHDDGKHAGTRIYHQLKNKLWSVIVCIIVFLFLGISLLVLVHFVSAKE